MSSITAYDLSARVATYDSDMDIMHPNRSKMINIALEFLPYNIDSPIKALDLGIGTGYFTECFLKTYPNSSVIAIDGAQAMVDLAYTRLGSLKEKVKIMIADFSQIRELISVDDKIDIIYSSYALHHLNPKDKRNVIKQAISILKIGGYFLNADLITSESLEVEKRIQEIRIDGIVNRAKGNDSRFKDPLMTRRFLDELEKNEGDNPLTLLEDLKILEEAGLKSKAVLWLEYREAVIGGIK